MFLEKYAFGSYRKKEQGHTITHASCTWLTWEKIYKRGDVLPYSFARTRRPESFGTYLEAGETTNATTPIYKVHVQRRTLLPLMLETQELRACILLLPRYENEHAQHAPKKLKESKTCTCCKERSFCTQPRTYHQNSTGELIPPQFFQDKEG